MQKYFLLLSFFSLQMMSMDKRKFTHPDLGDLYQYEDTAKKTIRNLSALPTGSEELTIIKKNYYRGTDYTDLELLLCNGDVITFTQMHTHGNREWACIYAKRIDDNYEIRTNASQEWAQFMKNLYTQKYPLDSQVHHSYLY